MVGLALSFALAGCNCVPAQGSCDHRPGEPICEDLLTNRNNHFRGTFENLCTLGKGRYSDDLCDHQGALGGCLCEGCENGRAITWLFPGALDGGVRTVDDVKKQCAAKSRTYVDP